MVQLLAGEREARGTIGHDALALRRTDGGAQIGLGWHGLNWRSQRPSSPPGAESRKRNGGEGNSLMKIPTKFPCREKTSSIDRKALHKEA
jgi:hypothetical protein